MRRVAISVLAGLLLVGGGAAAAAPRPTPTPTPTPPPVSSVELVKKSETIGSSAAVSAEVYCPTGKTAIGGGGGVYQSGAFWALIGSYPVTDGAQRPIGWHAEANRYGDESTVLASITVYAICATTN